jgi:hypothetical protein
MLVKDLSGDLSQIKVKIPNKYKHEISTCGLKTNEVYLYSSWFSGIWVKDDLSSDRVYPLSIFPSEVLDFEIVD